MRLIDADELRKNMFDYAPPEMEWDRGDIEHKIGEQPTIDAIPREWLLNKLNVRFEFLKRWRDGMPDVKQYTEIKVEDCEEIIDIIKSYNCSVCETKTK